MSSSPAEIACLVIEAFGGLAATKAALGRPKTTIHAWKKNGIPDWRWAEVKAAAKREGIKLPKAAA